MVEHNSGEFMVEGSRFYGATYEARIRFSSAGTTCRVDGTDYFLDGDMSKLINMSQYSFLEFHNQREAVITMKDDLGTIKLTLLSKTKSR